jgi:hypothetical protein
MLCLHTGAMFVLALIILVRMQKRRAGPDMKTALAGLMVLSFAQLLSYIFNGKTQPGAGGGVSESYASMILQAVLLMAVLGLLCTWGSGATICWTHMPAQTLLLWTLLIVWQLGHIFYTTSLLITTPYFYDLKVPLFHEAETSNVILALFMDHQPGPLIRFVESLRTVQCKASIFIFCHHRFNCEQYRLAGQQFNFNVVGYRTGWGSELGMYSYDSVRYQLFRTFLEEYSNGLYRRVMIADIEGARFQVDPFTLLDAGKLAQAEKMVLSQTGERSHFHNRVRGLSQGGHDKAGVGLKRLDIFDEQTMVIKAEEAHAKGETEAEFGLGEMIVAAQGGIFEEGGALEGNIERCFGSGVLQTLLDEHRPKISAGFVIGTLYEMNRYFRAMEEEAGSRIWCNSNGMHEALHNVLVHTNEALLRVPWLIVEDNYAGRIATFGPSKRFNCFGAHGQLLNDEGHPYVVLMRSDECLVPGSLWNHSRADGSNTGETDLEDLPPPKYNLGHRDQRVDDDGNNHHWFSFGSLKKRPLPLPADFVNSRALAKARVAAQWAGTRHFEHTAGSQQCANASQLSPFSCHALGTNAMFV